MIVRRGGLNTKQPSRELDELISVSQPKLNFYWEFVFHSFIFLTAYETLTGLGLIKINPLRRKAHEYFRL
jgi:hypothetical protein